MRKKWVNHVSVHGLIGGIAGYLFLHPISMIIHWTFSADDQMKFGDVLRHSFSAAHLPMSLFFVLLGVIIGLAEGIYVNRLAAMNRKLEALSTTDPLTGVFNRRRLFETLHSEFARLKRQNGRLAISMIDIDYFKQFNDQNGHVAGDKVLREVAWILSQSVREVDNVFRYGGEEFAIVFPGMGENDALHVIERLRKNVEQFSFSIADAPSCPKVTISAGIAELPDSDCTPNALIAAADKALYEAKNAGKNRTRISVHP